MDAPSSAVPDFFDPLLDYLSSILPPTVYAILTTLISYTLSLAMSSFSLVKGIVSSPPSSWDAQTILPPLITFLAAYLALVSLYRTTSWMIRTGIWVVKWGFILSVLAASAGWMLGSAQANGGNDIGGLVTGGVLPAVGGMLLDMLNGQNTAGGPRPGSRSSRAKTQREKAPRPKAWETWDKHREWEYSENAQAEADGRSAEGNVLGDIMGAIGRTVVEGGWWETAKGVVGDLNRGLQGETREHDYGAQEKQPERKDKSKVKAKSQTSR
ncbi:uncharacterized protein FIBRA_07924 [Fibroporia radiculosa]|uniref:Uncharacterized protein n=1 Tax=Fibroporia radiculosa TaxID=599839 RepID=J4GFY0_9APHY|nr:uncharacterized protein FIBRA_07924 [Fibroporia radiculosa]CCM05693.1 predicted protein [Fibroporia radiculosa]